MSRPIPVASTIGRSSAGGGTPRRSSHVLLNALFCAIGLGTGTASGSIGSIEPPPRSESAGGRIAAAIQASSNEAGDRHVAPSFTLTYLPGRVPRLPRCLVELPPMTGTSTDIWSTARVMIDGGQSWLILPSLPAGSAGLELSAGARANVHSIGPEEHVTRADGSAYVVKIIPEHAAWLVNLYDADTLAMAKAGQWARRSEFDARGFLTAMNAARTLCPNGFPAALVDERRDPPPDVGSGGVTKPDIVPPHVDGIEGTPIVVDLRGRTLPIDTPDGQIDRHRLDAFDWTPQRPPGPYSGTRTPRSYSLHAHLSFDDNRWLLLSRHCQCGNAYDPGLDLSLIGLSGPSAGVLVGFDRAYLDSDALAGLALRIDDDRVRLVLPGVGTYVHSLSATRHEEPTFEPSPLLTVERRGDAERESLQTEFRKRRAHDPALHLAAAHETRLTIEGRLSTNVWPVRRDERLLPVHTFVPTHPIVVHHEGCPRDTTRFATFEVVTDDPALAEAAASGRTVTLDGTMTCLPRSGHGRTLDDVRLAENTRSATTASPEGAWRCTTTDPTGSRSDDRFVFGRDGQFSSSTGDVRVVGNYRQVGDRMSLGFLGVERAGRTVAVDVRTHAIVNLRDERALDFTTIDAASGVERRVVCDVEDNTHR